MSHSLGAKLSGLRHKGYITDDEYLRLKKALEQQPCDDAVSRQAVVGYLCTHCPDDAECFDDCDDIKNIKALSPVTPQQKYGKWILADEQNKEDVENDNYRFICSECQCSDIHAKGTIVPYCWKCGAKMQESKETGEIHCNHTDTEIAKSFIEDVEAVKELLPKAGK